MPDEDSKYERDDLRARDEWAYATKKPITIEYRGPYYNTDTIETIEGDFEVDQQYIEEHDGYVIIRGVEDELYPCGLDIFNETYDLGTLADQSLDDPRFTCDGCNAGFDVRWAEPSALKHCPFCGGDNVVKQW